MHFCYIPLLYSSMIYKINVSVGKSNVYNCAYHRELLLTINGDARQLVTSAFANLGSNTCIYIIRYFQTHISTNYLTNIKTIVKRMKNITHRNIYYSVQDVFTFLSRRICVQILLTFHESSSLATQSSAMDTRGHASISTHCVYIRSYIHTVRVYTNGLLHRLYHPHICDKYVSHKRG
jgi:hypothetical protein